MSKTFCDLYPEECEARRDYQAITFGNRRAAPKFGSRPRRNITDRKPIFLSTGPTEKQLEVQEAPPPPSGSISRPAFNKSPLSLDRKKRKPVAPAGTRTRPIKASHSALTDDEIMKSKMLEASKIAELESKTTNRIDLTAEQRLARLQRGFDKAQRYLDKEGINYIVEPELSTTEGLVLINKETGIPKVAFRGTNFKNLTDLKTDLAIVHGAEEITPQFRSAEEMVRATNAVYEPVEELLGFSLGGAKAITTGNKLGIKTTTFNPAVGPQHLKNVPLNGGDNHTIIRTTEDPVSALAGFKPSAFKIKSLLPLQETKWLNPASGLSVHDLTNFSQTGNRRSNNTEILAEDMVRSGRRHAELIGLHDAKTAVEEGKSLSEWIEEFSPADITDGKLSNRIYDEAKLFRMWEKSGGDITEGEADMIIENSDNAMESGVQTDEFVLQDYEIEELIEKPVGARETLVQNEAENLLGLHEQVQERFGPAYATRDALKASMSPANLGVGILGGIAGDKLAGLIDPNNSAGIDAHQALSGGLGGGITAGAIATLGGEALTATALAPAVIAGAAGAVAGYETNKAVANSLRKAGANTETIESVSDITSGVVGGAATALTGIGASMLLGAELGELGGPAGVALGAGIGALFGLGQYAVGAIQREKNKPSAEELYNQQLAEEAGLDSYEEFVDTFSTTDTYRGEAISPEDNYYHLKRVEMFGFDEMRSKELNTAELVEAQENYEERIVSAEREREFLRTDPRAGRMRERSGVVNMGGVLPEYYQAGDQVANPYLSQGAIESARQQDERETTMTFNEDGSVSN